MKEKQSGKTIGYEIQNNITIPKYQGEIKTKYMKKYEGVKK